MPYSLAVVYGDRLSVANKRSIRRACSRHRLKHKAYSTAIQAALAISELPAVRRVEVTQTIKMSAFVKGVRVRE